MNMKFSKKCCIIEQLAMPSHLDFDICLGSLAYLASPFGVLTGVCFTYKEELFQASDKTYKRLSLHFHSRAKNKTHVSQ